MIYQVPPHLLDVFWPIARELLESSMARYGRAEMHEDVRRRIAEQTALLWIWAELNEAPSCAMVLEPDYDYLNVWLLGGDGRWRERADTWIDSIYRYAQQAGYKGVRATARPGLARILKARGWKATAEQVEIVIDGQRQQKPNVDDADGDPGFPESAADGSSASGDVKVQHRDTV